MIVDYGVGKNWCDYCGMGVVTVREDITIGGSLFNHCDKGIVFVTKRSSEVLDGIRGEILFESLRDGIADVDADCGVWED